MRTANKHRVANRKQTQRCEKETNTEMRTGNKQRCTGDFLSSPSPQLDERHVENEANIYYTEFGEGLLYVRDRQAPILFSARGSMNVI
jgi:hypothetical protein